MRTGDHVLAMINDLQVIFEKGPGRLSVPNDAEERAPMWKKKSINWDLPYWKDLEVRSLINVMHVMKNLCMNLLGFLGMYGKDKRYTGGTGGPAMFARKRRHASKAV